MPRDIDSSPVALCFIGPVVPANIEGERVYAFTLMQAGAESSTGFTYPSQEEALNARATFLSAPTMVSLDSARLFQIVCQGLCIAYESGLQAGQASLDTGDTPPVADLGQTPSNDTSSDSPKSPASKPTKKSPRTRKTSDIS